MHLLNAKVLIAAQFAPSYAGNFLASIEALANFLHRKYNVQTAFVLPQRAASTQWAEALRHRRKVYFTGSERQLITPQQARDIVAQFRPTLIYTHFEGYDCAFEHCRPANCRLVWHLHDPLSFHPNPLKAAYQRLCFAAHYGRPFWQRDIRRPAMIGVCQHELEFVKPYRLGVKAFAEIIPNGIDLSRIELAPEQRPVAPFTFLAFAGRNQSKRIDLLLRAGQMLAAQNAEFRIIITDGTDARKVVANTLGSAPPAWLRIVAQTPNVNSLFAQVHCFVSTSTHETFSYAIAEAAAFGLPIIQSDIPATMWNVSSPSALFFPSGSVAALADRMQRVIAHPPYDLARQYALQVRSRLSLDLWTMRIADFLTRMP